MSLYSSSEKGLRILAASDIRNVLWEIANLQDDVKSGIRLMTRLAGIVPGIAGLTPASLNAERRARSIPPAPNAASLVDQIYTVLHEADLLPLRNELRKLWAIRDLTAKRWAILHLAERHYSWSLSKDGAHVPTPRPMSQALEYLLRPNVHTSICVNPGCLSPYFFPSRRGQKYCSDACSLPAQRESKRSWWQEHGDAWRKGRKRKRVRRK
jgi:hypothetical protein